MPAYMVDIPKHLCQTCKGPAVVEVKNGLNAPVGYFCRRHGAARVNEMNRDAEARRS